MPVPDYPKFRCPLCGGHFYEQVIVPREGKSPHETPFFSCSVCTVMFRDPEQFTLGKRRRLQAAPMKTWGTVARLGSEAESADKEGAGG
jgi:hypothetical protein